MYSPIFVGSSRRAGVMGCALSGLLPFLSIACMPSGSFKITAMPEDQSLQERVVEKADGFTSNRIAIIDISGVLMNSHERGLLSEGEHVVSFAVEKLNKAAKDSRVKGVVLRINSPGGTVTASDTLYQEILAFKEKTKKPIVAYFQDVAASGAYYLACASDEIIAQRTTVTGSIGVIMQMVDLTGTMAKLGVESDAITSGAYKDAGSPFRPMKPNERELFQQMVLDFYGQFVDAVDAGRPKLTRDQVLTLADGRVYVATKALDVGLVDKIGTIHDAVDDARRMAGIKSAHTVIYHRPLGWTPNVYAKAPASGAPTFNLVNIALPMDWTVQPQFLYIWNGKS